MFAAIAPRYDLLNSVLSLSRHHAWRRHAAGLADVPEGGRVLDLCCGTGDFARELAGRAGPKGVVWCLDFCEPMLDLARRKGPISSGAALRFAAADAHALPFGAATFDVATIGFGIRNVAAPAQVFREMARVVRPGGRVVCLEFALPSDRVRRSMVRLYERTVVPALGGVLSSRAAYDYLATSIEGFARKEEVRATMAAAGLSDVRTSALHFGGVCVHRGIRSCI